jgi:hypothetical protein
MTPTIEDDPPLSTDLVHDGAPGDAHAGVLGGGVFTPPRPLTISVESVRVRLASFLPGKE